MSATAPIDLKAIRQRMKSVVQALRLPLRSGYWSGVSGSVFGHGTGSSLDFQDQRPYVPGDDPRHINWQAYARNGSYTMKLYRQEVSPRVDLLLDASASMFLTEAKAVRIWELAYFCIESALHWGASLKVHALEERPHEVALDRVLAGNWGLGEPGSTVPRSIFPDISGLPLRTGALRVLISDLLCPAAPEQMTMPLTANRGRGLIFAPYCSEESDPDWEGNIEFEDVETKAREKRRVPSAVRERYALAYRRHFECWREACVRQALVLARVSANAGFLQAMRAEATKTGAVEMV